MFNIQQALNKIAQGHHLSQNEMQLIMQQLMHGELTHAQIGALIMGLRMKGETVDEIAAAALVMRELSSKIDLSDMPYLVDIVGTGGDGCGLFNVSTASTFVISAAGATVAKHGNRGVSSTSGSSDVLEKAGIRLDLNLTQTEQCIRQMKMGFLFAPNHHHAMKYAITPRKELGLRSFFNVLGPLTNPAGVKRALIGVYDLALCRPIAEVFKKLGDQHIMVVHAQDGLDEISLASPTHVAELKNGQIHEWVIQPEELGIQTQQLDQLIVKNADESLMIIQQALNQQNQCAMDMIVLNSGAALYVSGLCQDYQQGVALAKEMLISGKALDQFNAFVQYHQHIKGE